MVANRGSQRIVKRHRSRSPVHSTEAGLERRDEILRSALRLFVDRGVASTSMNQLADEVGIQKASLYHFFESKEQLVFEVLTPAVEGPYLALLEIAGRKEPAADRLRAAMRALGSAFENHTGEMHILVRENLGAVLGPQLYKRIEEVRRLYTVAFRGIIKDGCETGEFDVDDELLTTFAIIGAINWMFAWYKERHRVSGSDVGSYFAELFLLGMTPRT